MSADMLTYRTPCCNRAVSGRPRMAVATDVCVRTCPACRVRYTVVAKPLPVTRPGVASVHALDWTPQALDVVADDQRFDARSAASRKAAATKRTQRAARLAADAEPFRADPVEVERLRHALRTVAAPCACGPSHDCRANGCDDDCEACNA